MVAFAKDYAPEIEAPDAENRVWEFFFATPEMRRGDRFQTRHPRREKPDTATKTASGVRYYGFRFYSPGQGRFLNRDPIEDLGDLAVGGIHHVADRLYSARTGVSATDAYREGWLSQSGILQLLMEVAGPNPYVYGFNNSQSWVDIDGRVAVPLSGVGDGTGRNHGRVVSATSTGVIALPKLLGGGATAGKVVGGGAAAGGGALAGAAPVAAGAAVGAGSYYIGTKADERFGISDTLSDEIVDRFCRRKVSCKLDPDGERKIGDNTICEYTCENGKPWFWLRTDGKSCPDVISIDDW